MTLCAAQEQFSFTRDACLADNRNKNATRCGASMGIQATHESAFHFIARSIELSHHPNNVSLWLELDDTTRDDRRMTIMSIASKKKDPRGLSVCDQLGIDFQIDQQRDALIVVFRTADAFVEPCQSMRVGLNQTRGLTHILVNLQDRNQQVFVNGTSRAVSHQRFDFNRWNAANLSLLSYPNLPSSVWKGVLYQLTFVSDARDAHDLIREGLPAAVPYSRDVTFVIYEDAEQVAGSHENDWYREEAPLEDASRIVLPYSSTNLAVQEFQRDHNVIVSKPLPRVFYYLVSLPAMGRLYQADGSLIERTMSPYSLIPVESGELIYIPPLDEHSGDAEFTSFEYCVWSDATLFHSRQCEAISTASIRVISVNDPPMALSVDKVVLREGTKQRIQLKGLDKDIGDSIRRFQITTPPKFGRLHLSVSSFRSDGLLHGTPLRLFNNTVACDDEDGSIYIDYSLFSDQTGLPVVHGNGGIQDTFSFRVQDQGGLWSNEEPVSIRILSALTGNSTTSIVQQGFGDENNIILYGSDNSGYGRRISLFVDSVDTQGQLLGPTGRVEAGQLLDGVSNQFPYQQGFAFTFIPSIEMCQGKIEANATFLFRVVAFADNSTEIASTSDGFSHNIQVLCQLDQLSLTTPEGVITVRESSLHKVTNEYCSGSNSSSQECSFAKINGISIGSSGFRSRKATVTVGISHGFISFRKASWVYTELLHGRRSMGWGNVTFRAFPEDLTDILTNLEYQSHKAGEANLQISIVFGNCSTEVLQASEASFWTPTCQLLQNTIRIDVKADPDKYKAKNLVAGGFPWPVLACMFVYPLLYFWWIQRKSAAAKQFEKEFDLKWIQHKDEHGMFYYEDTFNGTTTWQAPIGEEFKPWEDPEA